MAVTNYRRKFLEARAPGFLLYDISGRARQQRLARVAKPCLRVLNEKFCREYGCCVEGERGDRAVDYYVLQVAPREEEKAEIHIRRLLPEGLYGQCFHPMRLIKKKFHGKWMEVHEKLLPGYVFVTTESAETLYLQLKKIPLLTKMLGSDLENFVRLSVQERQWLDLILRQSKSVNASANTPPNEVGLSQIDIQEGNEILIVSGPLADVEGMVRKINLHKRVAEVEVPFMNGSTVIHLGIEMVERKE